MTKTRLAERTAGPGSENDVSDPSEVSPPSSIDVLSSTTSSSSSFSEGYRSSVDAKSVCLVIVFVCFPSLSYDEVFTGFPNFSYALTYFERWPSWLGRVSVLGPVRCSSIFVYTSPNLVCNSEAIFSMRLSVCWPIMAFTADTVKGVSWDVPACSGF